MTCNACSVLHPCWVAVEVEIWQLVENTGSLCCDLWCNNLPFADYPIAYLQSWRRSVFSSYSWQDSFRTFWQFIYSQWTTPLSNTKTLIKLLHSLLKLDLLKHQLRKGWVLQVWNQRRKTRHTIITRVCIVFTFTFGNSDLQ